MNEEYTKNKPEPNLRYGKYFLYNENEPYVRDDSTLWKFCYSLIDTAEEVLIAYGDDPDSERISYAVNEIINTELPRTDIDYEALMCAYAEEIGLVLYMMDNEGIADAVDTQMRFFGKAAKDSFNTLVMFLTDHILETRDWKKNPDILYSRTTEELFNIFHDDFKDRIALKALDENSDIIWMDEFIRISGVKFTSALSCYWYNKRLKNVPEVNIKLADYLVGFIDKEKEKENNVKCS